MNTIDDLRAAFNRLEAMTPTQASALTADPIGQSERAAIIVRFEPDAPKKARRAGRRVALLGGVIGVAASITAVALITTSTGNTPVKPGSGSTNPAPVSTSAVSTAAAPTPAPSGASTTTVAPTPACATLSAYPGLCVTYTNAPPAAVNTTHGPNGEYTSPVN